MATITISNATSTYTVGASDVLEVQSGGISQRSLVLSNGVEHIDFGGRSVGDTLDLLAWQVVSSGGAADGAILNGAEQTVSSGGMATNTKINSVGYQTVESGGTAIATTIGRGGLQTVWAWGEVTGAIVNGGGTQDLNSGGAATYTIVNSGGKLDVNSGGTATHATVNSGGEQDVLQGGTAASTTIAGGLVTVKDGAFTSGPITFAGSGTLNLQASVGSGTNTVFRSEIDGFGPGDTIDLSGFAYVPGSTRATISGARLTVTNGSATEAFDLGGMYSPLVSTTQDGSGGISVMAVPVVPPTVVGGGAATTVTEGVVAPFAAASIADPNAGSTDVLTIAMSGAGGTLADGAGFSGLAQNPDGSYALSGTAAAVTAELQALRFTPAAGQANTASTTTFALWDATTVRTSATNSGTTVVDLDPAVAPTVVGGGAATTVSEGVVTPFAAASIADPNAGSTETLTIALAGAGGTLADGAGFSGLARNPDGSYVLSGTAAAVTAELRALRFTPAAGPAGTAATTTFTLTDATTAGTSAMAAGAAVTDTDPAATTGSGTTPAAADTVSLSSAVTYAGGLFTLTGTAASAAGVSGVEISAVLDDGSRQDLGAATLDGDGAFTFQDAVGQNSQGFFEATLTDGAGHQTVSADPGFSLTGGFDQSDLLPRQTLYVPDGSDMSSTSVFAADGSRHVTIEASGQTLASNFFDTFHNHGTPGRTFVFDPGHGLDVVQGFRADGTDHDTLSFLGADFGGSLADLLGGARDVTGGVAIVDPTSGDTVKLTGVSAAELAHNRQDVAFHA